MCVTFGITLSHFPDADADSDSDPDSDPDRGGLSGLRFGSFQFGSVRFAWFGGRSRAGLSGRHLEPIALIVLLTKGLNRKRSLVRALATRTSD